MSGRPKIWCCGLKDVLSIQMKGRTMNSAMVLSKAYRKAFPPRDFSESAIPAPSYDRSRAPYRNCTMVSTKISAK